jgi:myosin protein heavy chain
MDLEDTQRESELARKQLKKEARSARASLSPEDKDVQLRLKEETKARQLAESRVVALERDLQDKRKELSTAGLSAANAHAAESKLQKKQEEFWRLESAHDDLLAENERLQAQLARQPAPATPKLDSARRAELLRGLQLSHDALGKDMSEQLRRLDAQPLTPSRRQNHASTENATASDPSGKRVRALETEISSLRHLLEDERDEKEFLMQRVQELEGRPGVAKPKFPMEQAMYSHFRLKAKSLRTQLD